MEIKELKTKLWALIRADDDPEAELENQYLHLVIPDRIMFFKYILHEWKEKGVDKMLERRWEHEEVPTLFHIQQKAFPELSPRDLFYSHLDEHIKLLKNIFEKKVPALLRKEERAARDIFDRNRVLSGATTKNDFDPAQKRYNTKDAADYIGVEVKTLYDYNTKGILVPFCPNGKINFYLQSQLDTYLDNKVKKKRKRKSSDF